MGVGDWRLYVDYSTLNQEIVKDIFPIHVINELLNELNGSTIFSKLYMRSSYHQIRVVAKDVEKKII